MLTQWKQFTQEKKVKIIVVFVAALVVVGYYERTWSDTSESSSPSVVNTIPQGGIAPTNADGINVNQTDTDDIQIGITLEQYEASLKSREIEVEKRLKQSHAQNYRHILARLDGLNELAQDAKKSYQVHIENLTRRVSSRIVALSRVLPLIDAPT